MALTTLAGSKEEEDGVDEVFLEEDNKVFLEEGNKVFLEEDNKGEPTFNQETRTVQLAGT